MTEPNAVSNAIGYAMHRSRSHDAVIRVYDNAGNVISRCTVRVIYFTSIIPLSSAIGANATGNCRLARSMMMMMMMFPAAYGVFLWFKVSDFDA
jgi:hypothetical protein